MIPFIGAKRVLKKKSLFNVQELPVNRTLIECHSIKNKAWYNVQSVLSFKNQLKYGLTSKLHIAQSLS